MFNKEESAVLQVLISQAISGDYDKSIYKKARSIIPKVEEG